MAIKCWPSYLHVFIFLHKKSFSIVTQLHVQVNGVSIYLNVHLQSQWCMYVSKKDQKQRIVEL